MSRAARDETDLWPEAFEDEGTLRFFLPGVIRLRNLQEDEPLPRSAFDSLWPQTERLTYDLSEVVAVNNQRDPLGGTLTVDEWIRLRQAFGRACAYCRSKRGRLVIEHVMPIRRGGRTAMDNVVPSCGRCNVKKRTKTLEEWQGAQWAKAFRERWRAALEAGRRHG